VSEAISSHQLYDQNDREDPEKQPARIPIAEVIGHRSGILGGAEGSNSLLSATLSVSPDRLLECAQESPPLRLNSRAERD
jgi:hypothetical protein